MISMEQADLSQYDLPIHFIENYNLTLQLLKEAFDEVHDSQRITKTTPLLQQFITLYESFSSEKQVFDSLNAFHKNSDPIYSHCVNVAILSRMLSDLNHMHRDELDALTIAALFHDIGKIVIDPAILNKKEALTPHEFHLIQKHTKEGYLLLHNLFTDSRIPSVCLMHHERCDGSGYPMGSRGDNINEFSRIIAICDVYAGMISSREYRDSLCPFLVIRLFEHDGLHKYDTDYTLLFLRSMLDTYIGYQVELNTGEVATITAVNPHKLSAPVVSLNGKNIDLSTDPNREILHILL